MITLGNGNAACVGLSSEAWCCWFEEPLTTSQCSPGSASSTTRLLPCSLCLLRVPATASIIPPPSSWWSFSPRAFAVALPLPPPTHKPSVLSCLLLLLMTPCLVVLDPTYHLVRVDSCTREVLCSRIACLPACLPRPTTKTKPTPSLHGHTHYRPSLSFSAASCSVQPNQHSHTEQESDCVALAARGRDP